MRRQKNNRHSISDTISVSLGLQNQDPQILQQPNGGPTVTLGNMSDTSNYLGRSYVSGFLSASPAINHDNNNNTLPIANQHLNKSIHASQNLHRQTAAISEDFNNDPTFEDDINMKEYISNLEDDATGNNGKRYTAYYIDNEDRIDNILTEEAEPVTDFYPQDENSRLLLSPIPSDSLLAGENLLPSISEQEQETAQRRRTSAYQSIRHRNSESTEYSSIPTWRKYIATPSEIIQYLPASILGLLLTILDALSYGMIIFPITEPIFSHLGPTGISMFYISTIISQSIFSGGWSSFPCGIGSEMIEVTPFFHTMAFAIKDALPEGSNDDIITTTLFCYVISSMLTGLTFYSLGKLHLGKIVGFFPRHILIGCIGGVGYFLIITGIEVSTRVAKFQYTIPFITHLFTDVVTLWQWLLPTLLTVILIIAQKCAQNSLVLPSFYILTLILFHFMVAIIPSLSLNQLRDSGWIFPQAATDSKWYDHYKLFNLHKVHWTLILKQIPTMLALTFFGILHVPINVPALAMSLQMDRYDVDKELIAHGVSNFVSGMFGSIQNYLVYTNSVLFIRAGADSALAGHILIVLTIIIMIIGPVIISFIPICIVGSLIFLLGYELLVEALVDPLGKISKFEYITIVIIVFTMGIFDFVLGVIVGILIACFSFLIDSTKLQTINGEFDGTVAKSTVYRDLIQTKFLNGIGEQIYVLKLQNLLFFGTIISIEEKIDKLLEISDMDSSKHRIKYLILDFKNINADNIDYSAAEGFNRIKRFTQTKRIRLIISSIRERDHIYNAFNNVGLLEGVELFNDLNSALEWCENEFLFKYKTLREKTRQKRKNKIDINLAITNGNPTEERNMHLEIPRNIMSLPMNTPRNNQMLSVAQNVFRNEEQAAKALKQQFKNEPSVLPLLLFVLKQYRPRIVSNDKSIEEKEIKFWSQLCPYLSERFLVAQSTLKHNNNFFFIVESGILKATFTLPSGTLYETMSNRTCYGKILGSNNETTVLNEQDLTIKTETDCNLWVIDMDALTRMRAENLELYIELVLLIMSIRDTRFKELLGYTLVSA
ncbi:Vsb1p NDAI_0G00990 [Naumovozyma dairenensis CBS 421]|uniref:STAS domain-containing protein n=1 Tax=Naumovozyma dairenensis (strain ATCC 10597 / BCRC 20456 / CBS 421 / NBRC 0211 / NRRL Y-12639) TaxID=1071378 RepID=G0WDL4_NAUDC|nr:hypothetical protein NDAI_0G00990 [Naumovozyma dairenensis CBS 421]CCD25875.2 hypothetical protein NDAI_0G00990 [Naumovozyma dairenensis CBS 421]